jgi:pimeloyl-ACP methyl ester carboxylesterase
MIEEYRNYAQPPLLNCVKAVYGVIVTDRQWFDAALRTRPETGLTDVDGTTVRWRAWGRRGDPGVMLVHGGGAHSSWWDHIGPLLPAGRRIVALDLSGHGDSGRRLVYGVTVWSREVLVVSDNAGISGAPILVGHSLGGFVSLHAASRLGPDAAGVITVDLPLRWPGEAEQLLRKKFATRSPRVYPTEAEAAARWRPSPNQQVLPYVRDHVAHTSVKQVPGGWTWKFDAASFDRPESTPESLTALECGSIHLRAEHGMLSEEMATVLVDRLGHRASVLDIASAGHHVMLDHPLELVAALDAAVSKLQ